MMETGALAAARRLIEGARRCAVLTGAGMSADSGVPTFRDAGGLWADFDPTRMASRSGFVADPARVWQWYASRREKAAQARPHAGYAALVRAEARFEAFDVITQNVDGLHRRAGSAAVIELHGSLTRSRCLSETCRERFDDPARLPPGSPPRCPRCGDWLRPDVVWFGECLDPGLLVRAQAAALRCQAMLVVGTSGVVQPAAGLALLASEAGARVVVVNPRPTELDGLADVTLRAAAGEALPALLGAGT